MVPKFRAWDKENDRMIYPSTEGVCFELDDDGINILDVSGDYPEDHTFPAIDSFLMQSTGLKDKNGVEIYCGDAVEWLGHRGIVEFVLNNQQTMIIGASGYITDLDYSTDFNTAVIGNIHENPKILGQANES